ncbi:protein KRI1 homolog [Euwallacea fornicatus]|uniref:protein KRI1 homolog n=1 Tax=Euwallacea fornicatus TaxID=995702 RepID=UPI00338EF28B
MFKTLADIFAGNSDSETEIQTQNEYAKGYDSWRKKEELNKLKTKYGEDALEMSDSSSSSDDDENATELTEEVERDFFKTLSYLKTKDPKIYDNNISFFKHKPEVVKKSTKGKEKPIFLKDYERKLLLEKGGVVSEDEDLTRTYVKEQEGIKEEIVKLGASVESDNDDDGNIGGILQVRSKTKEEETEGEAEYLRWLTGQGEELKDENMKSELKPLKDFWNDPQLDNGEKFLRDYVLKKKYLDKENDDYVPTYDEIIHDSDENLSGDEEEIKKQEEFEHKYNFRFEEPDQEFIKRYPRTIEKSLRIIDDKRSVKRAETKERKKKEKEQKMADMKQLKELKRKEIEEKLEKLREVTGTADLAFGDEDIDGDFDPEMHDQRMQKLFDEEFYKGPESDQKPLFPEIDEELEIENWDHWEEEDAGTEQEYNPHCEDDNFNMDADYNPSTSSQKTHKSDDTRGKKKRKRKSKVAEALCRPKPKFDPNDKNYEKYFEEYYKLDCEDIIGDVPCRFKYRKVIPNNFGLSVEEILLAKDKELNRWCSLKKMVQRRPEQMEKYDQIAYSKKADNVILKKKLLPSLFVDDKEDENEKNQEEKLGEKSIGSEFEVEEIPKKKILRGIITANAKLLKKDNVAANNKNGEIENADDKFAMGSLVNTDGIPQERESKETPETLKQPVVKMTKDKKKKRANTKQDNIIPVDNENEGNKDQNGLVTNTTANVKTKTVEKSQETSEKLQQSVIKRTNKKNKKKTKGKQLKQQNGVVAENHSDDKNENGGQVNDNIVNVKIEKVKVKKTRKRKCTDTDNKRGGKKAKSMKNGVEIGISDARLAAFGINPKKYKNKLKYRNKQKS